jgi:hypothetical protein
MHETVEQDSSTPKKTHPLLPCRVRRVRPVLVVARGRHWCVALLRRVRVEHDAPLAAVSAEWCRCCLCVWEALRVVGAAHEEQRVDGVLFCLLAGHAEDARPWCCRHPWSVAEIAVVLFWTEPKERGRCVYSAGSAPSPYVEFGRRGRAGPCGGVCDGDEVDGSADGRSGPCAPICYTCQQDRIKMGGRTKHSQAGVVRDCSESA